MVFILSQNTLYILLPNIQYSPEQIFTHNDYKLPVIINDYCLLI